MFEAPGVLQAGVHRAPTSQTSAGESPLAPPMELPEFGIGTGTCLHLLPFQCRPGTERPSAQPFTGDVKVITDGKVSPGMPTLDHLAPFQCSISTMPLLVLPTAQASRGDRAFTAENWKE